MLWNSFPKMKDSLMRVKCAGTQFLFLKGEFYLMPLFNVVSTLHKHDWAFKIRVASLTHVLFIGTSEVPTLDENLGLQMPGMALPENG